MSRLFRILLTISVLPLSGCSLFDYAPSIFHKDGYTLEKMFVLSRHNVRSPLSNEGSILDRVTPHDWISWSSEPSYLTTKGYELEQEMGRYFRDSLLYEGILPVNDISYDEYRIYANSLERTIKSATAFSTSLFDDQTYMVEYHHPTYMMDEVFLPCIRDDSDEFIDICADEMLSVFDQERNSLESSFDILSNLIDFNQSEAYLSGEITSFDVYDMILNLTKGEEPSMTGSLKLATQIADALVMQYYETEDDRASFGKSVNFNVWHDIAHIKDVYQDILFGTPTVAKNVARPMLNEIKNELEDNSHKFSMFMGHDSNLGSVMTSLDIESPKLPHTIEQTAPIGSKLCVGEYVDNDNNHYYSCELVYQNIDQIRFKQSLSSDNTPEVVKLNIKGLSRNKDNLYKKNDVLNRIESVIF